MSRARTGKHAATRAAAAPRSAPPRPTPAVLWQTALFGAIAVIVAVVALTWAGAGAHTAAAVGAGLLVVGAIAFLLLRRSGLLDDRDAP